MALQIKRVATAGLVASLALVLSTSEAPAAEGQDKAACADAYKGAQVQRKSGALKRARESLLVCVSDRCPSVIQPDCTRWLTEVEAALPSLAFAAKGADGRDLTAVKVTVDGQVLAESLDGKSIPIDPGSHALHFETQGETPIDQTIVVREGEKARVVSVSWAKLAAAETPSSATAPPPPPARAPVAAWVLGGVGVASLATFGVLALHGSSRRSDLKNSCYGHCSDSDVSSVKTEFAIADAALGVGIVTGAISTVLFLTSRGSTERASPAATAKPRVLALDVAPSKGGASVGVGGQF